MKVSLRAAYILLLFLFVLRAVASLYPTPWLWGLDSLADQSVFIRAMGLLLFAVALIPGVGSRLCGAIEGLGRLRMRSLLLGLGFAGALLVLFLLRSNNTFLGDTNTYLAAIARGVQAAGGAHREPLPQAIVSGVHALVSAPLGWGPQGAFTILGLVLGAGLLAVAALVTRKLTRTVTARVLLFSALAIGGTLQLFAGYAEFYAFAILGVLLFAWLGLRALEGRGHLLAAGLAFTFTGLCHAQTLFAAPAMIYLLAVAWKRGKRAETLFTGAAIPVAALLVLWLLRYPFSELGAAASNAQAFLPPIGGANDRTAYSLFSPAHWIELANVALLVTPVLPVVVVLASRRAPRPGKQAVFFGCLATGPILFGILANTQLGMIRDWDVLVLPVLVGTLWAAAAAAGNADDAPHGARSLAGMILLTCLLHTFFWMANNHSAELSRARIRRVAAETSLFGPKSLAEIWRYIGGTEKTAGMADRAAESLARAIDAYPKERISYRLLADLMIDHAARVGRGVEAGLGEYHALLDKVQARPAYAHLGACFAALGAEREDLAREEAYRMVEAEPDYPELRAIWGDLLRRAGEFEAARSAYERALSRDPDHPRSRLGLACLAGIRGDRAAVEAHLRETLHRTPWSPQAQQFARILRESGELTPDQFQRFLYIQ